MFIDLLEHRNEYISVLYFFVRRFHLTIKCFNDWRGRGYDESVPGEVTKTTPSGDRTTSSLHGRQACPEFNSFHQGVGQIYPR